MKDRSRRNFLGLVGAGGAAAAAGLLARSGNASAGHDSSNVFHLGAGNSAPAGSTTTLSGDATTVLQVESTSDDGTAVVGLTNGNDAVIGHAEGGNGVYGVAGPAAEDILTLHGFNMSGVQGVNLTDHGYGVSGLGPIGVIGEGFDAGVFGQVSSSPADDVNGHANQAGVRGEAVGCTRKGPCEPGIGIGVHGRSEAGIGVRGDSQSGPAFEGFSESGTGLFVSSVSGAGVDATSETSPGVLGWSPLGVGVKGIGSLPRGLGTVPEGAPGIQGIAPGDAPAVQCVSGGLLPDTFDPDPDGGIALQTVGRIQCSTAGAASVSQGAVSVFVPNTAVQPESHISVTLNSDPGSRSVHWVESSPGTGFTVHMTSAPPNKRAAVDFTYLIVEAG